MALDISSGGFVAHLLWPVLLSCWLIPAVTMPETDPGERLPAPGGHCRRNEDRAQAPARWTQACSSPWQEGAGLGFPHSVAEPCSLMRAGFFNETICLAFLTRLSLMGPSISPHPHPCLSVTTWAPAISARLGAGPWQVWPPAFLFILLIWPHLAPMLSHSLHLPVLTVGQRPSLPGSP